MSTSVPTKVKLHMKDDKVYSTLRQASPTVTSKLLMLEMMHSRGALCARRFPDRLPVLRPSPPSSPNRSPSSKPTSGGKVVDTLDATKNSCSDSLPSEEESFSSVLSHTSSGAGILTPRNLDQQLSTNNDSNLLLPSSPLRVPLRHDIISGQSYNSEEAIDSRD